jgi:hypothetical protein
VDRELSLIVEGGGVVTVGAAVNVRVRTRRIVIAARMRGDIVQRGKQQGNKSRSADMEIITRGHVWLRGSRGDKDEKCESDILVDVEFLPTTIRTLVSVKALIGHMTRSSQVLEGKEEWWEKGLDRPGAFGRVNDEEGCGRQVCAVDVHSVQPSCSTEDWHCRSRGPAATVV